MYHLAKQALILSALASCSAAFAQAKAPEPDFTLSYNLGATTDYRYRGISQSRLQPALQGGVDFAHKGGFYVGTWASTIKWLTDVPGGKGPLEWDIYGGFKGEVAKDVAFDVGVLRYQYPRENFPVSPNTTEVYGALTFGPATIKYSHSTTNLFGFTASKGSGYLDASASFDVGSGWSVAPHIGRQSVKGAGNGIYSCTDYSVALNKDLGNGLVLNATAVGTNVHKNSYVSPSGKNLGRNGLVIGAKFSF